MNIGIVSLGCAKNQVDLEEILAYLKLNGFETVADPALADVILVNTCGFIDAAKKESIRAILDMVSEDKPVIVTGCLATRYLTELQKEIPEVALWIPLSDYPRFGERLQELFTDIKFQGKIDPERREFISPQRQAYLRISDGCDNFCTFCAIPDIRGRFKSVPLETLTRELDELDEYGIRSLTIISQDTSMYGRDIGHTLADLLREVIRHPNFDFVKLMYLYPDEVTDEVISLYRSENITPYFDLPVQHFSDEVLRRMGRRGTRSDIIRLINKFREAIPEAILRTTIMVGFPGETEEDMDILLRDIADIRFDHLGCFMYSPEENTLGATLPDQIPDKIKKKRYDEVMRLQKKISYQLNKERIGKEYRCLITGYDENTLTYSCINNIYAADDIDGEMRLYSRVPLREGDLVRARVVNAFVYDLEAEVTEIIRRE